MRWTMISKKLEIVMNEYIKPTKLYGDEDPLKAENAMLKNRLKFVKHMLKDLPELVWHLGSKNQEKLHEILYRLEMTTLAVKDREDK